MADLTIQKIVEAGLKAVYGAAAGGGDAIVNTKGDVFLHAKNADAATTTITITAQSTSKKIAGYGSMTKANAVIAIPAGEDRMIGPFPPEAFNDAAGKVEVTYSSVTSLTVAAIQSERAE